MPSAEVSGSTSTDYSNRHLEELFKPLLDSEKQDVHYRASKAKILKSLGHAAYRNGLGFAVMFVSPDGQVADAFASESLQPKLEAWLGDTIKDEARELVTRHGVERERRWKRLSGDKGGGGGGGGDKTAMAEEASSAVFGSRGEVYRPDQGDEDMSDGEGGRVTSPGAYRDYRSPPTINGSTAGLLDSAALGRGSQSVASSQPSPSFSTGSVTSPGLVSTNPTSTPSPAAVSFTFTPSQLEQWYAERFADLSHKTDKIVCRSWIKVIEPAKQTRFPYQKGDETKPPWWPDQIRHKEPDHIAKAERLILLNHLLRSRSISVEVLECATASVAHQIPPGKMAIMHEIYSVAKAERKAIASSPNGRWDQFTIALPPRSPAIDEDASANLSPVLTNESARSSRASRHRTRNSVGSPGSFELTASQQTPRNVRATPYPLARSASASQDLAALALNSTSPSIAHSPASTSLSRSTSLAGLGSANGAPSGPPNSSNRPRRLTGRSSIGEADLPQTTPYAGGRVRPSITPRQQGSPLSASLMGRSASTSAIGAKTMMDDSVASPAMIKSRSKLSQKCFEQMGNVGTPMSGDGRGPPTRRVVGGPGDLEYGQLQPQHMAMVHPGHFEPPQPAPTTNGFPHAHQPYQPHPRSHPQAVPVHPHPMQSHPSYSHHPRLPLSASQPHLTHSQSHRPQSLPHPGGPQVQVQVQVHAGHDVPQHLVDPSNHYQLVNYPQPYANSPLHPHPSQFASPALPQHPSSSSEDPQQRIQYVQHPSGAGGSCEHAAMIQPHQAAAHEAYLHGQHQQRLQQQLQASSHPSHPGYLYSPHVESMPTAHPHDSNPNASNSAATNHYLSHPLPHSAPTPQPPPLDPSPDLGAYMDQIDMYQRQHAEANGAVDLGPSNDFGDESTLGLGLGFNGVSGHEQVLSPYGGDTGGGSNDSYYGQSQQPLSATSSKFDIVGGGGGGGDYDFSTGSYGTMEDEGHDAVHRRYDDHAAFGIMGQA